MGLLAFFVKTVLPFHQFRCVESPDSDIFHRLLRRLFLYNSFTLFPVCLKTKLDTLVNGDS